MTFKNILLYLFFITALGLGTLFFNYFLERKHNPNQEISSSVDAKGNITVELDRNNAGQYISSGLINDYPVTFLIDTGANDVAISGSLAKKLNLKKGYKQKALTAGGVTDSYLTRFKTVSIGKIEIPNIRGRIIPAMDDDVVLLGMSFLKHISFNQQGRKFILTY